MCSRNLKLALLLFVLPLMPMAQVASASTITWEGAQWVNDEQYHQGATVDVNGNLVFGGLNLPGNLGTDPRLHGINTSGWTWVEYSFIDPGVGLGTNYIQIDDETPPSPYNQVRAWIGAGSINSNIYQIYFHTQYQSSAQPGWGRIIGPRSAGSHTVLIANTPTAVQFWFDGVLYDYLWAYPYLSPQGGVTPPPISQFEEVYLGGVNSTGTDFKFGTGTPPPQNPPQNTVPEPGTMLLLASGLVALTTWRCRRRVSAPK